MNTFRSYLTELFDRTFELYEDRNQFSFFVEQRGGRLLPVPHRGEALDRWVEANYTGTTPAVYRYIVDFTELWLMDGYEDFKLFYALEHRDLEDIYELGFERRLVELAKMPPRPKPVGYASTASTKHSQYYWESVTEGSDEDLNWLGAGDASAVIGTVVEAAKRFAKKHRPSGIVIGTKSEANPARGRIYKALARKAAAATRGTVTDLTLGRGDMAAPAMVWFRRGKNPFKYKEEQA